MESQPTEQGEHKSPDGHLVPYIANQTPEKSLEIPQLLAKRLQKAKERSSELSQVLSDIEEPTVDYKRHSKLTVQETMDDLNLLSVTDGSNITEYYSQSAEVLRS